jgi:tripartite-type tricarboxylate transporter receptor subunit TctC
VRSAPDGYTLLFISTPTSINATLYDNLNFNFIRDIAPIASLSRGVGVMVVTPSFPAKTLPEFISYAKANPGKIGMASGGYGSLPHVYGELFKMLAGVDLAHVPYRGTPLAARSAERPGAGDVRLCHQRHGKYQSRQAARARGDHGDTRGRVP